MQYYLPKLKKNLTEELLFYNQISLRYDLVFCLMLIHSKEFLPDSDKRIKERVRIIDRVRFGNDDVLALFFLLRQSHNQEVLVNRIIEFLRNDCHAKRFHIGVACNNEDSDDILVRALQNMLEARDEQKEIVYDF